MRSRRRSSVQLDSYYRIVYQTILRHQDPNTGLLPGDAGKPDSRFHDAWIRDNVYSIMCVWALSLAYKKSADYDEDKAKAHELAKASVKCMRGLLMCMMRQRDKVEKFKETNSPVDSIHAKFSSKTGLPVVGDKEWGHLQIDAISLYLLTVAQMTASGLQVIYSLNEVDFIQNLVFCIESAYCIPDYGIWERGDKSNTGIVELNASSIGMAFAALEAMEELDLFGIHGGGPSSKIHVMLDEAQKCRAVLQSMLPRESLSKETDSALLTITGFPAFAVENRELCEITIEEITSKLAREYGCIRFLRDGYKTPREDSSRLHYEPWELRLFENIECHWPLFYCFLVIQYCFEEDEEQTQRYSNELQKCIVWDDGVPMIPELYSLHKDFMNNVESNEETSGMITNGRLPMMWAQSLYVIGCLLKEKQVAIGELDPINRRLSSQPRPETIVQVVILAENRSVQEMLMNEGLPVKMVDEIGPVEVHSARVLSHLFTYLGKNESLKLTGRKNKDVGILMTSKLYRIQGRLFAFTPQRFDFSRNYMDCDTSLMVSTLEYGVNYLATCWSASGRPTLTLLIGENMLDGGKIPPSMLSAIRKMKNGLIHTTRVCVGTYDQFLPTSCVRTLSFLNNIREGHPEQLMPEVARYFNEELRNSTKFNFKLLGTKMVDMKAGIDEKHINRDRNMLMRKNSVRGAIRKSSRQNSMNKESTDNLKRKSGIIVQPRKESGSSDSTPANPLRKSESIDSMKEAQYGYPTPSDVRERLLGKSPYQHLNLEQLVERLVEAETLEEQTDILHYLVLCYGLKQKILLPDERSVEIRDLLKTLYDTACMKKQWSIVRHCAGYLGRRVDDLSKSVTDMLVRQKQVTVGMPPHNEVILSGGQLKSRELRRIIHKAYHGDESMAMLTQELLVYLAMCIQTEPHLFHGMLRLRIGLIIDVMATEMQRSLKLGDQHDAIEELMSLSPYEMRNLLHHIMAGDEFHIDVQHSVSHSFYNVVSDREAGVSKSFMARAKENESRSRMNTVKKIETDSSSESPMKIDIQEIKEEDDDGSSDDSSIGDIHGSWIRRRRLDGALNRVPLGFYSKIWNILESCHAIVIFDDKRLETSLTQEMTSGEMKFALVVESVLNSVPEPEYRQMLVEALCVVSMIVENQVVESLDDVVYVESIVEEANKIFIEEQTKEIDTFSHHPGSASGQNQGPKCVGAKRVCKFFYDSAPSGSYGTLSYLVRGACKVLDCIPNEGDIECKQM